MVPEKKSLGPKEWKIKQRANCTTRESFFSHVRPRREQRRAGRVAAQRHHTKLRVSVLPSTAAAAAPGSKTALSGPGEGSGGQPQPPLLSESQSLPRKSLVDFNSCRDSEAVRGSPYWGLQLMERSAPPWVV